jgi:tRNA(adenine34) deaminase
MAGIISFERTEEEYMREAYKEAVYAYEEGEIPVGAIVVCNNKIIARGHNQTEALNDVTAHAEMIVLTAAENYLGNKYLNECDIYITLEPCVMCAGAMFWAQFNKVVFGCHDPRQGYTKIKENVLHPRTKLVSGILQEECEALLKKFFLNLRRN